MSKNSFDSIHRICRLLNKEGDYLCYLLKEEEKVSLKMCLNLSSILFAAMLASEFFVKFSVSVRLILVLLLIALIVLAVTACPPRRNERSG